MTWQRIIAAGVVGIMGVAPRGGQQRPAFRSVTDRVSVDVAVRQGQNPVTGLTSGDFIVEDNGVAQDVDTASIDSLPVDVTLAIDVSTSVKGEIERFKANIRDITALLRPTDRVRIVTFGSRILEVEPMQAMRGALALTNLAPESRTAMNDGIFYALAWPPEPERRHLVVAFTDGHDTSSAIDDELTVAIASRADAVLHVVVAGQTASATGLEGSRTTLERVALPTGGELHKLGDAVKAFRAIFEDFRASYVLSYTLTGVNREGWHDIAVKLKRPGLFTVRARRGYFVG